MAKARNQRLQASLRNFGPEQAGIDAEFFTRVAFFGFLEVHECKAILSSRLAYLQRSLEYLHKLQQMADADEDCTDIVPSMTYAQRVLAFHIQRTRDEYAWIASWLEEMQAPGKMRLGRLVGRRHAPPEVYMLNSAG